MAASSTGVAVVGVAAGIVMVDAATGTVDPGMVDVAISGITDEVVCTGVVEPEAPEHPTHRARTRRTSGLISISTGHDMLIHLWMCRFLHPRLCHLDTLYRPLTTQATSSNVMAPGRCSSLVVLSFIGWHSFGHYNP